MPGPLARQRKAKFQLRSLYRDQEGICCYCDGPTWLPRHHTQERARRILGIPDTGPGSRKLLEAARATREHLKRRADGGGDHGNLKMACNYCNTHRGDDDPEVHRVNMQVLAAASLHPVNRLPGVMHDDPASHMKRATKALKKLRAGSPIT